MIEVYKKQSVRLEDLDRVVVELLELFAQKVSLLNGDWNI